jgi:hypothetical protein
MKSAKALLLLLSVISEFSNAGFDLGQTIGDVISNPGNIGDPTKDQRIRECEQNKRNKVAELAPIRESLTKMKMQLELDLSSVDGEITGLKMSQTSLVRIHNALNGFTQGLDLMFAIFGESDIRSKNLEEFIGKNGTVFSFLDLVIAKAERDSDIEVFEMAKKIKQDLWITMIQIPASDSGADPSQGSGVSSQSEQFEQLLSGSIGRQSFEAFKSNISSFVEVLANESNEIQMIIFRLEAQRQVIGQKLEITTNDLKKKDGEAAAIVNSKCT